MAIYKVGEKNNHSPKETAMTGKYHGIRYEILLGKFGYAIAVEGERKTGWHCSSLEAKAELVAGLKDINR